MTKPKNITVTSLVQVATILSIVIAGAYAWGSDHNRINNLEVQTQQQARALEKSSEATQALGLAVQTLNTLIDERLPKRPSRSSPLSTKEHIADTE